MKYGPDIALVAALIGDPARANILTALMDGGSMTAGELAEEAGISPSTASFHLARLRGGALVVEQKDGRNRFFALSDPAVAELIENLMTLSESLGHVRRRPGSKAPALRHCRVCYDHLAGALGVQMFAQLKRRRLLMGSEQGLRLTRKGRAFVGEFGIDIDSVTAKRRAFCLPCRDWSEQSYHLGGALGAAFLEHFFALRWARRDSESRIVRFTSEGESRFRRLFDSP